MKSSVLIYAAAIAAALPPAFNTSLAASTAEDQKLVSDYTLSIHADREDAIYKRGEEVDFQILLRSKTESSPTGEVSWKITKDGLIPPLKEGKVTLENGKAIVSASLDEPGVLACDVLFNDGKQDLKTGAAAAIEPLEIKPSLASPDDFDAFWNAKKDELANIPLTPEMNPVETPADRPGVETFDITIPCVGKPVSGYFARPSDAALKSAPALLYVDGAGVRDSDKLAAIRWAQKGFIALAINAHGIPNGQPKDFYINLANTDLKNYRKEGSESRDTYYFLGMYLRVLRALDFLAAQPEWDGKVLVLEGVSQGGAQAIAGAALDPRVSLLVVGSPAMCDHTGMLAGRVAGWPKLVSKSSDGTPDPAILETARYFDSVNFAPRIKADTKFWIGFLDNVTPPTGQFAAYNAITAPKELFTAPDHGHGHDDPNFWNWVSDLIFEKAAAQKSSGSGS